MIDIFEALSRKCTGKLNLTSSVPLPKKRDFLRTEQVNLTYGEGQKQDRTGQFDL